MTQNWSQEQINNANTIIQVGQQLGASPRDIQIALMTAMQESNLININYGDAAGPDSLGLFQQRAPWGSAQARMDPAEAARMFFEGGATGEPGLFHFTNRDSMSLTQAAQAVQVSAFPNAYAKWANDAASLMGTPASQITGGAAAAYQAPTNASGRTSSLGSPAGLTSPTMPSAQSPAVAAPVDQEQSLTKQSEEPLVAAQKSIVEGQQTLLQSAQATQFMQPHTLESFTQAMNGASLPGQGQNTNVPAANGSGLESTVISKALAQVGTPYVWGGTAPGGFDCSGLVQWAYGQAGINLPRVSFQQANSGKRIGLNALQPGDLVAFDEYNRNGAGNADHIAIYLGNNQIIEAPHTGADVRVRTLSPWDMANAWGVDMSSYFGGGTSGGSTSGK